MRKVFIVILIVAIMALLAAIVRADETHYLFSDVEIANLPATCSPGHIVGLGDAADLTDSSAGGGSVAVIAICNGAGNGWLTLPIMSTHWRLDRVGLPSCGASTQDTMRIDASGDLCFCDGSSWALITGTACEVLVANDLTDGTPDTLLDGAGDTLQEGT